MLMIDPRENLDGLDRRDKPLTCDNCSGGPRKLMTNPDTQLLTLQEAADRIGISIHTMRDWQRRKKNLTFICVNRKSYRVSQQDVDALISKREMQSRNGIARHGKIVATKRSAAENGKRGGMMSKKKQLERNKGAEIIRGAEITWYEDCLPPSPTPESTPTVHARRESTQSVMEKEGTARTPDVAQPINQPPGSSYVSLPKAPDSFPPRAAQSSSQPSTAATTQPLPTVSDSGPDDRQDDKYGGEPDDKYESFCKMMDELKKEKEQ